MNIRTTALFSFVASASENGLPSRVVSWKSGAAAPMAGARRGGGGDEAENGDQSQSGTKGSHGSPPGGAERLPRRGEIRRVYTANKGRSTTGSNFQTYLYAPLKKSIVIS